jgi:adenylate cyclase class 2
MKMASEKTKVQHTIVELKAEVENLSAIRSVLIQSQSEKVGVFHQVDTYYEVPKGRFKLREVEGKTQANLIYYEREDLAKPKKNSVFILSIPNPKALKLILEKILKVKSVVDKVREIYIHEGVQVHLDTVKGLGHFIEFERVTSQNPEQQEKDMAKLERLRVRLGISPESLKRLSYSDLT